MSVENRAYVSLLVDTLKKKKQLLESILRYTQTQTELLEPDGMDTKRFEETLSKKGKDIEALNEIDDGFSAIFRRVEPEITAHKEDYRDEIHSMQKSISQITDLSVRIQALEKQNNGHFKVYLATEKNHIRESKESSKMAASYYQNMANRHQDGTSYFFNKQK